jgi:hypothetical protein
MSSSHVCFQGLLLIKSGAEWLALKHWHRNELHLRNVLDLLNENFSQIEKPVCRSLMATKYPFPSLLYLKYVCSVSFSIMTFFSSLILILSLHLALLVAMGSLIVISVYKTLSYVLRKDETSHFFLVR